MVLFLFRGLEGLALYLWAMAAGAVFFWTVFLVFLRGDGRFLFEMIFLPTLLFPLLSSYTARQWPHYAAIPYMFVLVLLVDGVPLWLTASLMPLLNIHRLPWGGGDAALVVYYSLLAVSVVGLSLYLRKVRREKERLEESLSEIRRGVEDTVDDISAVKSEGMMKHLFSSLMEEGAELKQVLTAARAALYADGAFFFERGTDGGLRPRAVSEGDGSLIMTGGGVLAHVMDSGEGVIVDDIKRRRVDLGYLRREGVDSMAAVRVMDGNYALGVLAVESDRYRAFMQNDLEILEHFSAIVGNIINKARAYRQFRLEHDMIKVLHDQSADLLSTIELAELCGRIVTAVHAITEEPVLLFLRKDDAYELIDSEGVVLPEERLFRFDGTLLHVSTHERAPFYHGEVSGISRVLPFDAGKIESILCLKMFFEDEVTGLIIIVSGRKNAFNPYQVQLLEVLANQASVSIANARFHHRMEQMAITDGLTGLYNHRYFQERLDEEIKRVGRNRMPLSLILTDIDRFKAINDDFGHPVGDSVLREFAGIIRGRMRETDIGARYGGEEFALILVNTDAKGARKIAEDIREAVGSHDFSGVDRKVTVSLGVSCFPQDADSKEEFIERTDQALYAAKEGGRNRTVLWSDLGR